MALQFELETTDPSGARLGTLHLGRGSVQTPIFMPVATQAAMKTLLPEQVSATGSQVLLVNSYHLHLKPGEEVVESLGGLHRFMNWAGPIITDSGGYQVFSLPVKQVSEAGVEFQAEKQGRRIQLGPESAIALQERLGADIIMAFDECVPYPCPRDYAEDAMRRTIRWAERCKAAWSRQGNRGEQALFGIVQGSTYADLRSECAQAIADLDLPGIAVGGLSVGEGLAVMEEVLSHTVPFLPVDKPRYLMGVGLPEDILASVEAGLDMSDCVIPSKVARSGILFTRVGKLRITRGQYRKDKFPPDTDCACPTCAHYSRAYLHHLFKAGEILGQTLATIHNLHFYQQLMEDIRQAIAGHRFAAFKRDFLAIYQREERKSRHVR